VASFFLWQSGRGSNSQSPHAGGMWLPPVQKLVATIIFISSEMKMQTSLVTRSRKRRSHRKVASFFFCSFLFSLFSQIVVSR